MKKLTKQKTYINQYAYFIRRVLKSRGLSVYGFSKTVKIANSTFHGIVTGKSKKIKYSTLIQLVRDLGYSDLRDFVECFEQFERYGIIVKTQIDDDFTPLEVTSFCLIVTLTMILMYFILR